MTSKILKIDQVKSTKNSVLAYGHFNTIHPGHIRYLKYAKDQGKILVVALMGDEIIGQKKRFQFDQKERAEALALIDIADIVVLLKDKELEVIVDKLEPNILVLGKEYENLPEPEMLLAIQLLKSKQKSVQFHAGDIHYANTDLLDSSERVLENRRRQQFRSACKRQGINLSQLLTSMEDWGSSNIIVLGDTIVDQYAPCEALGMSAEAPVVVVRELANRNYIGGAAIVASHIRALGANCDLISVIGEDDTAQHVKCELNKREIGDFLVSDKSRPTTLKKRYVVENQKLFRVSRLEDHYLDPNIESEIINKLELLAPKSKAIVVSDFVYGVITDKILEKIQDIATQHKLMLFGDLQCSSQVGAVTKFKNFTLLCPNEREARIALQNKEAGLELLSQKLLSITKSQNLLMKLGAEGFIVYDRNELGIINSQSFPALSVNPLDVAGAGDSLLAVMATGLANGQGMMQCAAIGCCMAALAVETMGNTPIGSKALIASLEEVLGK